MFCPKCGKTLLAREGILQAGRKYHRECWTCAQCSVPLTTWVRRQPISDEYLCNICHIRKNGLKEGTMVINWQKQTNSMSSLNAQSTTLSDDILLI